MEYHVSQGAFRDHCMQEFRDPLIQTRVLRLVSAHLAVPATTRHVDDYMFASMNLCRQRHRLRQLFVPGRLFTLYLCHLELLYNSFQD